MFRTRTPPIGSRGRVEADSRAWCARVCLKLVGNDASYGMDWEFEDWQTDNVWNPIFGCGRWDRGRGRFERRYRRALIGVERGLGKTVTACAMLLCEATMNPVRNGQYGLVADSKENADNAFQTLSQMIKASPELSKVWQCFKAEVRNRETGAWVRVFPNKVGAVQGFHFNLCILDEIHVYRDDGMWRAVTSGQRGIPNALAIAITTASDAREGFCWDLYQYAKSGEDPALYCYWVGIDDEDDPDDRSCWGKVLVSPRITMADLEDQRRALGKRAFMRYQLNYFPPDLYEEPFVSAADVDACTGVGAEIDRDEWFCCGVDAAPSGDDTALVAVQQKRDGTWAVEEWVWPGRRADFYDLGLCLQTLAACDGAPTIVIDPNRLKLVKDWLWNEMGVDLFDFPQTPKSMCPASELLRRAVRERRLALAGLEWVPRHLKNAVSEESRAYGERISSTGHGPNSRRIDSAVALAMAMSYYDGNVDEHAHSCGTFFVRL